MSDADNRHPHAPHAEQGWQPLPQGGEYESEATAFVQLPEGFTTGVYGGRTPGWTPGADPLAAPGHGYTPPASFTPHAPAPGAGADNDPSATGQWTMPFADPAAGYADQSAGYPGHTGAPAHHDPHAGYQGGAPDGTRPWGGDPVDWPVAGSPEAGGTGSWSVPAAADDGLEESGEYLVGDERLTGRTGHAGLPGHPGHDAAAYQGGYPGAGAYDTAGGAADTAGAAHTGHWNFTTGLSATGGAQTPAEDVSRGDAGQHPYGGPAEGSYAPESAPRNGAAHDPGPHGGTAHHDTEGHGAADPYGTGAGTPDTAATGHWSLPADALAQWPPPGPTAQPAHDGAVEVPAPAGAGSWTAPAADQERPQAPDEFAPPADGGPAAPGAPEAAGTHPDAFEPAGTHPDAFEPAAPAASFEPAADPVHDQAGHAPDPAPAGTDATAGDDGAAAATGTAGAAEDADRGTAPDAPSDEPAAREGTAPDPAADEAPAPAADSHDEHPAASYVLRVNGIDRPVTDAWIGESLLYVLRERLGLAGAKDGCSQGECGACSVQVDGRLVASCLVPAATSAGSEVRTVEGLAQNGVPSDVQRALAASGAVQCGFCVPGMAMTVHDLLEGNHAPSELETRKALCGNLCRCSGYRGVLEAVEEVVKERAEAAEAAYAAPDDPDGAAPADTARIPHQAGPADPMGPAAHDQDPHTGGSA
ncbi:2Fe-2S iron-sulfur cluster-binding protein [Streptomyces lydicus]|uniref:2Fe-2S iron-sulfur cluster-binding protein n=1 Tax=Streptomyces lydicus TaxID=47763 RepID=UPI0037D58CCF